MMIKIQNCTSIREHYLLASLADTELQQQHTVTRIALPIKMVQAPESIEGQTTLSLSQANFSLGFIRTQMSRRDVQLNEEIGLDILQQA
jgi:hypothetical protein